MDLIQKITDFFRKPKEETRDEAPEGLCPLCWGHQQYDHQIRELYKDKQVDVNNHKDSYMLVKDFVVNKVEGIKLQEGETETCPSCGGEHEKHSTDTDTNR